MSTVGEVNPFKSPTVSVFARSIRSRSIYLEPAAHQPRQRRFKSARLVGEYEKPWTIDSPYTGRERWDKVILWSCITVGFLIGAVMCWREYAIVPRHQYCLVLDDNFSNLDNWSHEIQTGGFGVGSFEWTTDDPANSYVLNNQLHVMPTLTTESTTITPDQLANGYTLNLTTAGTCTSTDYLQCGVVSNATAGTIINPVRSARLTTAGKATITYGRVEVVAKMPQGDWLWPAIWMMPEGSVYGVWPRSGEIDIAELRGNNGDTYGDGRDTVTSALHWGINAKLDMFEQTYGTHSLRRTDFSKDFHTFGLEWSEEYLYTFVDNRLLQVLSTGFGSSGGNLYTRGGFANLGQASDDPWSQTGHWNTPFDQPFHLIISLAVGGTNGYFLDGHGNKPWVDSSSTAARDFWRANSTWIKSWGSGEARGMTVRSVKMWQQGACPT